MITLSHGAGGEQTRELVENLFLPRLKNRWLLEGGDAAVIDPARLCAPLGRLLTRLAAD